MAQTETDMNQELTLSLLLKEGTKVQHDRAAQF